MDDLNLVMDFFFLTLQTVWSTLTNGNIIFNIVIGNVFFIGFVSIFKKIRKGMGH